MMYLQINYLYCATIKYDRGTALSQFSVRMQAPNINTL